MKKILLIDNQDSFIYNVYHLFKEVTQTPIDIYKNNQIPFCSLQQYSQIILSPGPGIPQEAGELMRLLEVSRHSHSILGICLGLQAIALHFGAKLVNLQQPLHGHSSTLIVKETDPLLSSIVKKSIQAEPPVVGLYHSWAVDPQTIPEILQTGSVNEEGIIMTLYHKELPIYGMQFHPESVITRVGKEIAKEWIDLTK
ncbi:MAG: aminodeoxychorismate/anthranilate synthase component II [Bacteroidales bacterium]|nr:aminodeoxychorismate/anthranilate synthase component II [Bacteroidales bacterium]